MSNLLNEGRYDNVTNELTKEIIYAVKKGVKKYRTRIRLFSRTFIDIIVKIKEMDNLKEPLVGGHMELSPNRGEYKKMILDITVSSNKQDFYTDLNKLVAELKNIIRHEIEHIAQDRFKSKERGSFFSTKRRYPEDLEYYEYLTEPYEVEAYVRGLYKKAKTMKEPLNILIDEFGNYLESINIHPDEIKTVLNTWRDYAKRHLIQTPYRKWGYIVDNNVIENLNEDSQRVMGFRYKKPDVNCIMSFEVSEPTYNKFRLMDRLDSMNVKYNSVKGGGGKYNSFTVDLDLYDEKEAQAIINDLNIKLMLEGVRITNSNFYFPKTT